MKKTKILLPILSVAGVAAAVAPMVCLTSCSLSKVNLTMSELGTGEFGTGIQKSSIKNNASFNLSATVVTGCKPTKNIVFVLKENDESLALAQEKVSLQIYKNDGTISEEYELQWDDTNHIYIFEFEQGQSTELPPNYVIKITLTTSSAIKSGWQAWLKFDNN